MADPLSAAGTAAGVLSLGIQVCQGLINYISAVHGRDDQIRATRRQAQTLHSALNIFRQLYPELERYDKATAKILNECLLNSREHVTELEGLLKSITNDADSPRAAGARGKAKRLGLQMLYPFRQESFRIIQDRINNVLLNLHTVTQAISL